MLAAALIAVELWCTVVGLPAAFCRALEEAVAPENGSCQIGWAKGGLFTRIELGEITFTTPTDAGTLEAAADALSLNIYWWKLLTGRVEPKSATLRNATAQLFLPVVPGEPAQTPLPPLAVNDLSCTMQVSSNDLMQGQFQLTFQGISIKGKTTLLNGSELIPLLFSQPRATALDPDAPAAADFSSGLVDFLRGIQYESSQQSLLASKIFLNATITGDLRKLDHVKAHGDFGMATGVMHNVVVPSTHGQFNYHNRTLELSNLQLLLSNEEVIQGKISADFTQNTVAGEFNGTLFPATALRLADCDPAVIPDCISFQSPVEFELTLPETPLNLEAACPTLIFTCPNPAVLGLTLKRVSGELEYHAHSAQLRLQNAAVEIDSKYRHYLRAEAEFDLGRQLLSAELGGILNLPLYAQKLGLLHRVPPGLHNFDNTRIHFKLEPSPLDVEQFNLHGQAAEDKWRYQQIAFRQTTAEFSLNAGKAAIDRFTAELDTKEYNLFEFAAQCDFTELLQEDDLTCAFNAALTVLDETAAGNGFNLAGEAKFNPLEQTLALPQLRVTARPELLNGLLQEPLELGDFSPLAFARTTGEAPVEFSGNMPVWNYNDGALPQLTGSLQLPQCTFLSVPFDYINCAVEVNTKGAVFSGLSAQCANGGPNFTTTISVQYLPLKVAFDDLRYHGAPEVIEPFLIDNDARKIYRTIWENIVWGEACPAEIEIPRMCYEQFPRHDDWRFTLDGTFDTENAAYRAFDIQKLHAGIKIDLPEDGLTITELVLQQYDESPLTAEAVFHFGEDVVGDFTANFNSGKLDFLALLRNAWPETANFLQPFSLDHKTHFTCRGRFSAGRHNTYQIEGTMDAPWLRYRRVALTNLQGEWNASNQRLSWNVPFAQTDGGTLASAGVYDAENETTSCFVKVRDVALKDITSLPNALKAEETPADPTPAAGVLDGDARFTILKNWGGEPLQIEGSGTIYLREADLWRVPLMTALAKMSSAGSFSLFSKDKIESLGKITQLRAKLEGRGKRIDVSDIATDGTIMSLHGYGNIAIDTGEVDFIVRGAPFRKSAVFSWLFKPITWAFEAELTGTLEEHEWTLNSTFLKWLND